VTVDDVFSQIAVVLAICVLAGGLATLVRLPPLVGLLIAGIAVGPQGLGVVAPTEEIALLGEIGIALLLFVVGLELDPRVVRRLGPVVLAAGLAQVTLTSAMGYGLALLAGASPAVAAYLAAATAFSSTVVVIKVLGDRRELEQLHGRLAVGILIVQDLVVVVLLIAVTASAGEAEGGFGAQAAGLALRGAVLLGGVWLLARFVLPRATHLIARSPELLVLAAVTWAVAAAAAAHLLGFSAEVGAILAGVALSTSRYREAISGRLTTLRDFLLVFFFIDLGTHLEVGGDDSGLLAVAVLSVFVLVIKPLLVAGLTTALGFRATVGIRAGLNLAQISEFSLILVALGVGLGQLDPAAAGTVTLIAVVTITASTFLSARSEPLSARLRGPLLGLERRTRNRDLSEAPPGLAPGFVVIGYGRLGQQLASELRASGESVLAVDFDPRHHRASPGGPPVVYGDAEDPELPEQLPLGTVRWVISTLRDNPANRQLAASLRHHGFRGRLALSADHDHELDELRATGADIVVRPFHVAAGPLLRQLADHDDRADLPARRAGTEPPSEDGP
jgi:Kef-type K+ transport system membrane component KefB